MSDFSNRIYKKYSKQTPEVKRNTSSLKECQFLLNPNLQINVAVITKK